MQAQAGGGLAGLDAITFAASTAPGATYPQDGALSATQSHTYTFDGDDVFAGAPAITATDRAGNEAATTFTVVRDAGAPQVSVSAQVDGDYVVVSWSASDPSASSGQAGSGLGTCALQVREDAGPWQNLSNDCAGSTTFTAVWAGSSYTFRLQAADRVGNTARESASLLYNGDPPQVSVEAQTQDDAIVVTWSATDPGSGLDTCTLEMRADGETWEDLSDDCAGTITPTNVLAGQPYTFRLTATDNAGNIASVEDRAATSAVTKYYYFGNQRVAMRKPDGAVNWLHGDHLGSTSLATDGDGGEVSRQLYYPFGEVRWVSAEMPTDFGYTGQRLDGTGLMFYHARYYAPTVGRFVSADSIVPNPADPQDFNRYSYVGNNALRYTDPSGHCKRPGDCVVLGGGDRNPAWEFFIQGRWYEGWSFDEFRPAYQAGLDAAIASGDKGLLRSMAFADGLAGALGADVLYAPALAQAESETWLAASAAENNRRTAEFMMTANLFAPMPDSYWGISSEYWIKDKWSPTISSSVSPQHLIDDIVENELKNVNLTHYPNYSPSVSRDRYGQALPGAWTEIGPVAIEEGRRETLITIVHEEMHHRLDVRGWFQSETYVEAVAQRFARIIYSLWR